MIEFFFSTGTLLLNVLAHHLFRCPFSHRTNISSITPKLPTPKLFADRRKLPKHLARADALEHLHDPRWRPPPRCPNEYMHVIPIRPHILDSIPIALSHLAKYLPNPFPTLSPCQQLLAILHAHHHMVAYLIDAMAACFYFHPHTLSPIDRGTIHPSRSKLRGILVSLR
jgi:hypothetical protein